MKELGLYIHIPFCKSKCYYCDFNSYSGKEHMQEEYVDSLIKEMESRSSVLGSCSIKSIYIGGGTPTFLNLHAMGKLLSYLKKYAGGGIEYTCEANPGTLTSDKLLLMRDNGVNRISIGLQSWDDRILKKLGRIHCYSDFLNSYNQARRAGFDNVSIDLMFSIQGQSLEDFENSIDNVISIGPEHISCYSLIIEEGTPFYKQFEDGALKEIDEDTDRSMYYMASRKLKDSGYFRYEISNYAKLGYESKHNIIYWKTGDYLGVGAGAHSCIENVRFSNIKSPEKYIGMLNSSKLPLYSREELSELDRISEFMFMGLRMTEGVDFLDFKKRFNKDLFDVYANEINTLETKGLIKLRQNALMLTDLGVDLSNQVFVEFLK